MKLVTNAQIMNKTVCVSFYTNSLRKGMNPSEKENSELKQPVLHLKTDLVSYPVAEGFGKYTSKMQKISL